MITNNLPLNGVPSTVFVCASKLSPAARRASYYDEVELALTDFLGRKVKVGTKPGKESGVLEIDFFDKEDLSRLADALKSLGD